MLVWFTDTDGKSVAIDNRYVVSVFEEDGSSIIDTITGVIIVEGFAVDVVARLNTAQ